MFLGFVSLDSTITVPLRTKNSSNVLSNADSLPTYRIYSATGTATTMPNGTGSFSLRDSGSVTGAANNGSGLIRIAQTAHGFQTGDRVTIAGIVGTTEANTTSTVTVIDSSHYDLQGSTFVNAYVSGGTANVTGLYYFTKTIASADTYSRQSVYSIAATYAVTSVFGADYTFVVS